VVADLQVAHALADRLDDARALVAEHRRGVARRVDARGGVHVRVADAACDEAHEHLTGARLRELELLHDERLSELLEYCGTHAHAAQSTAGPARSWHLRDATRHACAMIGVMRKVIYSMTVSLDGFIAGPDGDIGWGAPDDELHRFHNERVRDVGVQLCGRRLYEVMTYWDTALEDPSLSETASEFAHIWERIPKVVFSTTLETVSGNARLATGTVAEEIARLKEQPGADIAVGGAGLAAACIELGLVDVFQVFVSPIVLGAGTPFFPPTAERIELELLETRTFGSRVVYLHYGRV